MAGATATVRQIKNKDTGLDLTVNSYKETKEMVSSSYEYQVMVVSNLSFFKTAKHKDSDNVQFTVLRKFADFEDLYAKMNSKYSGTAFPSLPKKVLMMNEAVAKERRATLDHIMKFFAMTTKLCTCPILLEFLGVSSIKAGKFRKMEVSDSTVDTDNLSDNEEENKEKEKEDGEKEENDNLFNEENGADSNEQEDEDIFTDQPLESKASDDTKIFENQDVDEEEGDLFLLPDAKIENTNQLSHDQVEDGDHGDHNDLFRIEDDLDEIMNIKLQPKHEVINEDNPASTDAPLAQTVELEEDTNLVAKNNKPPIKSKPNLKPALKAKPQISAKPSQTVEKQAISLVDSDSNSIQSKDTTQKTLSSTKPKPPLKQKPQLATKPDLKPKPKSTQASTDIDDESDSNKRLQTEEISEDDIMKYIQENSSGNDDVALFS